MGALSLIVVGAGIVGLCIACEGLNRGFDVTIVDRDPEGDKCSFGNAGGIAVTEVAPAAAPGLWRKLPGWLLDPLGPIAVRPAYAPRLAPWLWSFARAAGAAEVDRIASALALVNQRVDADLAALFEATGLTGEWRRRGALTVYESPGALQDDEAEWRLKRRFGVEAQEISGAEARAMEPALGERVACAVFTPQWSHVSDPKLICEKLRLWLLARGVAIVAGSVAAVAPSPGGACLRLAGGETLAGAKIVIAAGAWSGALARPLGDRVRLESERGYNTTLPHSGVELAREIIFAERKFVATPLSCGLRIGGAAEFGGLEAAPNFARSAALAKLARRYLPSLDPAGGAVWCGHRPTTPDSLPVIGASRASRDILYAFGHGHLGLTQAPTTARLIGDLLTGRPPPFDLSPFAASRF